MNHAQIVGHKAPEILELCYSLVIRSLVTGFSRSGASLIPSIHSKSEECHVFVAKKKLGHRLWCRNSKFHIPS